MYAIDDHSFNELLSEVKALRAETSQQNLSQPLEKWLTISETCKILNISRRTFFNFKAKGKLPFSQIGNKIFIKAIDVEKLLEENYSK